ncbi:hypothetical protein GJU40_15995 [Bacillus lacus]|uniref:Uncharacterized protein n=1 Tax=Metabacillus lacus TaxID=1983721 RepID=A0A7X2J1H1_9BACI|nr:hypothetical protein [Metabacillus lacus]MRX73645.1 hypothetical protein [Metabacillus lacus]
MYVDHDNAGNPFIELRSWDYGGKKEFLRITRVEKEAGSQNLRFQIRETKGNLRAMGPEFPTEGLESLISAVQKLKIY